jgi:hypothetical protein
MLEQGVALLGIERAIEGGRQGVEGVLDGELQRGARCRLLAPVERQQCAEACKAGPWRPPSTCFSAATIWLSVNLLLRIFESS